MSASEANKKILILTERFFPEEFLINDLAAVMKNDGMDVEILTQVPSYPQDKVFDDYSNFLFQTTGEFHDLKIHRVKTFCGYNKSVFRKIFNYLNFALLTSVWCLFNGFRYSRVFVYHTGPLTMATAAVVMHVLWRKKCTIWTQDIWPDSVYAYGFKPTWWKRILLNSFIRGIYSACDRIAVSSPVFAEKLHPYTRKEIQFIPQWNQIDFAVSRTEKEQRSGHKIFTFAGNLGTAQNLDVLAEAFGELNLPDCTLQFVGGGVMLEPLKKTVQEKGYGNILFTGRLPQKEMPEIFAGSDFMIISLKDEYSMTIPAKFQAYIAAGKPIFGIIGGDTGKMITDHDVGVVAKHDKKSIQEKFAALAGCSDDDIARWQNNAAKLSENKFNRIKLINKIKSMITDDWDKTNNNRIVFPALAGMMLLGAALTFLQHFLEPEMSRDSSLYLILLAKWSGGGINAVLDYWPNFWIPPLYLYSAVLLIHAGLLPETAALAIGMTCGILMPLVSFAIARELFNDKRISLAAALLTAVNPSIIEMSVQAQRDVPYLFSAGWCIYLIIAGIRRNKWYWWCGAGCIWGLGMLIRFEMIEFLPILGMYFFFALWKNRKQWLAYFRNLIIFMLCGIVVMMTVLYMSGTEKVILNGYKKRILSHVQQFNIFDGGLQK